MGWTESELRGNSQAYLDALADAIKERNKQYERVNKKGRR